MQTRQTHIDVLKLMAAQFIVLHHFANYGPLAAAMSEAAPGWTAWLYDDARMAVQVFLVLGGYLAASSLAPEGLIRVGSPWRTVIRRYLRLALPFMAALLLAVTGSLLARHWLGSDFIPAAPTWGQMLSHALLLHGVLGVESLSAGVWYVAIDFQLFALMTGLLWLGRSSPRLARTGVLGFMLASLFFFNLNTDGDNWALYFFGAYGMGAAAFWSGRSCRRGWMLALLALVGLLALVLDFRGRIALALVVALLLGLVECRDDEPARRFALPASLSSAISLLGQTSYALFLVHFPVLMLGNVLFARLNPGSPWTAALVLFASWAACVVLALMFERWVEAPLSRLRFRTRSSSSSFQFFSPARSTLPRA